MRQVILDTETTGLEVQRGHRIIEIGCVELVQRRPTGRTFHHYLNPDREIDEGARAVTGISDEFLRDKPRFADIVHEFLAFIDGAEVIAHNAAFDVGFLDAELARAGVERPRMAERAEILDTLALAREKFPGQRNSLDALCKRLDVDNSHRGLHGALLDANLLAEVYLALTAGQGSLGFFDEAAAPGTSAAAPVEVRIRVRPRVLRALDAELVLHAARLDAIDKASRGACVWKRLDVPVEIPAEVASA
ncbi:MAG: DNA polymerase III subunit epsilon [Rhodanobacteraceae bacterium]|jgi:DNA polymerase-3 subunit epsilon|nr:DNA polymerase III subunit epsilon [Rhodanobacteraceae bacterium]